MAFYGWLIWISFSNCPRRCCFSLAHAAQASMARFYFHDFSFLCRKAQRTNYQANPLQAHAQALPRPQERKPIFNRKTPWSNTPSRPQVWSPSLESSKAHYGNWILSDSVCSHLICHFGFFPGVLSVFLRQHHYFSQQEGPAQRNIAVSYKRERSISFSQ